MPKSKEPPSLQKFAIKPPPMESLETETPPTQPERTRAKNERVLLSLRINREDWYQLHDFANRQGSSLQSSWLLLLRTICRRMESNLLPDDNTMTS